ncbi:helix-turn-helix transcriptional regulator [Planctomycetota bacterium]|nr:helix-turn-helix transcriptional regulator [Planctomycetota bacterium]
MTQRKSPLQSIKRRSSCSIATATDLFGDKWTLLVLRDLHIGKSKYSELADNEEHIPTNRLAERLKKLQAEGLITKTLYQKIPKRYEYRLTDKGKDTIAILQAMSRWSLKYIPQTTKPPSWFFELPNTL